MIIQSIFRIITLLRHLKWRIDALILPKIPKNIHEFKMDMDDRLLVIAPHADDELIGCHCLISRFTSRTKVFYCAFLGHNTTEENSHTRQSEFCAYMQKMNVDYEISSPKNLAADLSKTIKYYKPTIIALPSFIDWHPEHRQINLILRDINTMQVDIKVLWYHVSLPLPVSYINSLIPMSREQHLSKWSLFTRCYESQLKMDVNRFIFIEKKYKLDGHFYEVYNIQDIRKWEKHIEILQTHEKELDRLKETLGDIYDMFTKTEYFYRKIQ